MQYPNKFKLSRKENIFLAKKELVRSIWSGVNLEGFNMTYPETETVLNRGTLVNAEVDAIICANNLKRGWNYLLGQVQAGKPISLREINRIVAEGDSLDPGNFRTGEGGIVGTSYRPPIKPREQIEKELSEILSIESPTHRALELFAWGSKGQHFWDGNKRTSFMATNDILIRHGAGLLTVTTDKLQDFNQVLHEYYEHDKKDQLLDYLYDQTISAGDFSQTHRVDPLSKISQEIDQLFENMPYDKTSDGNDGPNV